MRIFGSGLGKRVRVGLVVGLLMAPAAPVFGQTADPDNYQRLTLQARNAYRAGDLRGALAISQRVADATARQYGTAHVRHAQALNNLALFQDLNGALAAAAANYQLAITITEAAQDADRRLLADLKNNLAAVVLQQCRMREARGLYADALKLTEANFGAYHPETEFVRANVDGLDRFAAGKATGAQAAQFGRLFKSCVS